VREFPQMVQAHKPVGDFAGAAIQAIARRSLISPSPQRRSSPRRRGAQQHWANALSELGRYEEAILSFRKGDGSSFPTIPRPATKPREMRLFQNCIEATKSHRDLQESDRTSPRTNAKGAQAISAPPWVEAQPLRRRRRLPAAKKAPGPSTPATANAHINLGLAYHRPIPVRRGDRVLPEGSCDSARIGPRRIRISALIPQRQKRLEGKRIASHRRGDRPQTRSGPRAPPILAFTLQSLKRP